MIVWILAGADAVFSLAKLKGKNMDRFGLVVGLIWPVYVLARVKLAEW